MNWAATYLVKRALLKRGFADAPTLGLGNQRESDEGMRISVGGGGMGGGGGIGGGRMGGQGGMPSQVDPTPAGPGVGGFLTNALMTGAGLYSLKSLFAGNAAAGGAGAAGAGGAGAAGAGGAGAAGATGATGATGTGTTAAGTAGKASIERLLGRGVGQALQWGGRSFALPGMGGSAVGGGSAIGGAAAAAAPLALLAGSYYGGRAAAKDWTKSLDTIEQADKSTKNIETELAVKNRNREILSGKHDWRYKGPEQQKQLADLKARIQRQGGDKTPVMKSQDAGNAAAPASGGGWQTPTGQPQGSPATLPGQQPTRPNQRLYKEPQGGAPVSPSLAGSNPLSKAPAVSTAASMPASMQKGLSLAASPKPGSTSKIPAVPGGGPPIGGAASKPGATTPKLPKADLGSSESQVA